MSANELFIALVLQIWYLYRFSTAAVDAVNESGLTTGILPSHVRYARNSQYIFHAFDANDDHN